MASRRTSRSGKPTWKRVRSLDELEVKLKEDIGPLAFAYRPADDPELDPGIRPYVEILNRAGIETCQSCQGGDGHSYEFPTIEFWGSQGDGWRALSIALEHRLPVCELRREWNIDDGEPVNPVWVLEFTHVPE